jgi:PIN domain nuclease of toxin-antitoxin system
MPQVPVYGDRQVRTEALRPVYQNTPDVSSGARAVAQGLNQVAEAADRIDLRDAQAKASETEAKITSDWLKWDSENRNKYRGANADGYAPAAEEWWKSAAETAGKDLSPRAKAIASQSLRSKQTQALGNVQTFAMAEKERHADETYSADVATTIQFGVTSGDVASTAVQIREKAAVIGARKGWTTEQVQAEAGKNLSAMHLAQISKLAEQDATKAQAYYDTNKAEVNFAQQARVEQVLKAEMDNQFATQTAAAMADKPLSEQLAEAAKITDPQRREKTLTQVRNNYALVKQAEQEREGRMADQAWQAFAQGQKIPEAVLSGMNGRERVQLQEAQRTRAERLAAGKPVKTDMGLYIDVREKLARGEKVDLRALTEKIGKSEMETLIDIQTTASKGGVKQDSMLTDEARINAAIVGLGIDKKKNPEAAVNLTNEIDRRVRAASAAKGGKDLTADEKQGIVDRVVMDKVYVDEWGTDPQKPLALLTPDEVKKAYVNVNGKNVPVSSVPALDRRQIVKALQATGQQPTEQAIVEMYLAGKQKGAAK